MERETDWKVKRESIREAPNTDVRRVIDPKHTVLRPRSCPWTCPTRSYLRSLSRLLRSRIFRPTLYRRRKKTMNCPPKREIEENSFVTESIVPIDFETACRCAVRVEKNQKDRGNPFNFDVTPFVTFDGFFPPPREKTAALSSIEARQNG